MSNALIPVEEQLVEFYDDEIPAARVLVDGEERVYVGVRAVCEFLGADWSAQRRRIMRNPVLSEEVRTVAVTATQLDRKPGQRETQEVLALPLSMIHGWLFGFNADRVKPELRDAVIRYQRECYAVLAGAFDPRREYLDRLNRIAEDMAELAQATRAGVADAHTRMDKAAVIVRDLGRDVASIQERLGMGEAITPEQAQAVKGRVQEVGGLLGQVPGVAPRRNAYAGVWSEVYRRFGVPSYRELQQRQFAAVLAMLDNWADDLRRMLGTGEEERE